MFSSHVILIGSKDEAMSTYVVSPLNQAGLVQLSLIKCSYSLSVRAATLPIQLNL